MAKIIAKIPCDKPDCTHPHEMEIDYEEPKIPKASTIIQSSNTPTQTLLLTESKPVFEEPKPKTIIESFKPSYNCPDGNCGAIHKNKNYRTRPKGKCKNCGQFSRIDKGKCPWCTDSQEGEIEPIDDNELNDLGIPLPVPEEHEI